MATLREIDQDLRALERLLMEVGGDVTEEEAEQAIKDWFNEVEDNLKTKLDGYATVIDEMKNRSSVRREEAQRLYALARIDENAVERLKENLLWFMKSHDLDEIQAELHRFRVANNGGVQPMVMASGHSPADYVDTPYARVRYEWDTDAIRQALKEGKDLPFATLEERGQHVRIK